MTCVCVGFVVLVYGCCVGCLVDMCVSRVEVVISVWYFVACVIVVFLFVLDC